MPRLIDKSLHDYNVLICHTQEELAERSAEWDRLLVSSVQRSPMLSYAWVSAHFQHRLKPDDKWFVVFVTDGSKMLGVLPIVVKPNTIFGLQLPIAGPPSDSHTLGGDLLVDADADDHVINLLINTAEKNIPGRYFLKFSRIVENSPTVQSPSCRKGRVVFLESAGIGYYYPVAGNFDDYYSSMSKNMRGNLRRAENNLSQLHKLEVRVLENDQANADFLDKFMPVESCGWKGRVGSAISSNPELEAFYRTLTSRLQKSGMLRWESLYADNVLIATNLSIRFGEIVVIWKLGYDESLKKYSPGGLLFKKVLEQAYPNPSISEFNLMSDTAWQEKWNPGIRNYSNLLIFPLRPVPLLLVYLPLALKQRIRRIPFLLGAIRFIKSHFSK